MNQCKHCGTEYPAKRADSQYCSPACRKAASRKCDTDKCDKPNSVTDNVTLNQPASGRLIDPKDGDCDCMHCQQVRTNKSHNLLWHGPWLPASQLAAMGPLVRNRVSLPGDQDYSGVCA